MLVQPAVQEQLPHGDAALALPASAKTHHLKPAEKFVSPLTQMNLKYSSFSHYWYSSKN